jgi:ferredoxin-NADP reductase
VNSPARREWQGATAVHLRRETARVASITFEVPAWAGHMAGQHVDVRLTAADGYQAQRSYSIASPAGTAPRVELTVERVRDGEVSPYLTDELRTGDVIELRGPFGGYFTWDPGIGSPLMLIGGGSGVVPLMSILRTRCQARNKMPARLLYSSRSAEDIIYRDELDLMAANRDGLTLVHTLTRGVPNGWKGQNRRVDKRMLEDYGFQPDAEPQIFVCGPTSFVESVADQLVGLGHRGTAIKTERFGPTGEKG